jgi:hypothetical protein
MAATPISAKSFKWVWLFWNEPLIFPNLPKAFGCSFKSVVCPVQHTCLIGFDDPFGGVSKAEV